MNFYQVWGPVWGSVWWRILPKPLPGAGLQKSPAQLAGPGFVARTPKGFAQALTPRASVPKESIPHEAGLDAAVLGNNKWGSG